LIYIFLDEADSLFAKRDGDKSGTDVAGALLKGMSSHQGGIYIIAATNFPDRIDSAFFRRFTTKIYIPMPTKLDRMKILQKLHNDFCKTKPEGISDLVPSDFEWLAAKTEDYSSGDLETFMKRLHSEPFTSLRRDKYFRRSESSENVWVPCTKFEEGAEVHHWEELRGKGAKIQLPPFRRYHMINVLEKVRPSMPDKTIVESVNRFKQQYAIQK
jgi:SpoVK/Ycf46/Vps4 family AAA+-type ATPase